MKFRNPFLLVALLAAPLTASAASGAPEVSVTDLRLTGRIEGPYVTFTLDCDVQTRAKRQSLALFSGDVVLDELASPTSGHRLQYDPKSREYRISWPRKGKHHVKATFAVRPNVLEDGQWREASFAIPASRFREVEVVCDREDLEIEFPGAMRVERRIVGTELRITAVQGAGRPFALRWKPHVQELDAKLVLSSEANTIATLTTGALRLDTLLTFDIPQGRLNELRCDVPESLSITQVRGAHIRDWRIVSQGQQRVLEVELNQPLSGSYSLQILADMVLGRFPQEVDLPVISPSGGIRAGGQIAIGTDSAIALVVRQTSGLSQIDTAAFKRIVLNGDVAQPRPLPAGPQGKVFCYSFAGGAYQIKLALDDIVPSFDAMVNNVVRVQDDDLRINSQIELDVRDAPLRRLVVDLPAGVLLADVKGPQVTDSALREADDPQSAQSVQIDFGRPVMGRTLIELRLELGRGPLDGTVRVEGLSVRGAKSERGYLVVVPSEGIQVDAPVQEGLREVRTGSVPQRVANAEYAYRFREKGWSIQIVARARTADVRAELFHLVSLADGIAYGGVTANYFIAGAPVDKLHFVVAPALANVEFVGRDVLQAVEDPENEGRYTVKLNRKVTGDYNLGVTYTQRYKDGGSLLVGGVACENVGTQVGFVTITSYRNLELNAKLGDDTTLLEIAREELPSNYRLLVNAPILKTYKYVGTPHEVSISARSYERGELLSIVIEVMDIQTRIAMPPSGSPEAVTRVRYMVKNATQQFLVLSMPAGADVWTTRVVENFGSPQQRPVAVTASQDRAQGRLLIPLKRGRDPNQPLAVEVEYGQVLAEAGWGGDLSIEAPQGLAQSTFDRWTLFVPEKWSIHGAEGSSMIAEPRTAHQGDLALLMNGVRRCWGESLKRWSSRPAMLYVGLIVLGLLISVLVLRRSALAHVAVGVLLALSIGLGIAAATSSVFEKELATDDILGVLSFTQQVNMDARTPLHIEAQVVPAWRQHATLHGAVTIPAVAVICLIGSLLRRRWRRVLLPIGVSGLMYAAAQFHTSTLWLAHLLTWGLPAILGLWFAWRVLWHRAAIGLRSAGPAAAATATCLLVALCAGTADASQLAPAPAVEPVAVAEVPMLDRIDVKMTAGSDSVQLDLELAVRVQEPATFVLLDRSAVLLSGDVPTDGAAARRAKIRIVEEDGRYLLRITRKGDYSARLSFLLPVTAADSKQLRHVRLALPPALTNRVQLDIPHTGLEVQAPTAMRLTTIETEQATRSVAMFGPGDEAVFSWKPRARQRQREQTVFYTRTISVAGFDAGLVETRHHVHFQIAQGELRHVHIEIPEGMTVTSVQGRDLGAWRFDPATHVMEAKLSRPAAGAYDLAVTTQTTSNELPYTVELRPLRVREAARQRQTLGIVHRAAIQLEILAEPQTVNVDDFSRDAASLLVGMTGFAAADPAAAAVTERSAAPTTRGLVRHAYRLRQDEDVVRVRVVEVRPELRAVEVSGFTVADERLVYNGQLNVVVAKAGVFSVQLRFASQYDIDALSHALVSHWDERIEADARVVEVHFKQKILGVVPLKLAMSMPVSELPRDLAVPRVELIGALKHTGRIIVSSDRGVSLSVSQREGVSELDPMELGIRNRPALAFKLLRPDWRLQLQTNVIQPRITVDFLHTARVTEGLIRHAHTLRYLLENAGSKTFEIQVPPEALGVVISGADIARRDVVDQAAGRHRIELNTKWYDRPYLLTVQYETRYDRAQGAVDLRPVKALDAHLQRGHLVVQASDRIKLTSGQASDGLRRDEARSIPAIYHAGDLSDAIFCYRSSSADYQLSLRARRHEAASLLEADVQNASIESVVTEGGQSLVRVKLQLSVGGKRHLQTRLPQGAEIWSLTVNGRPTVPSIRKDAGGAMVHILPLAQASSGELAVALDFIYVTGPAPGWRRQRQQFTGPRFDLPLKNVRWTLYLPEGYAYDDFEGTLAVDESLLDRQEVRQYSIGTYESEVVRVNSHNQRLAAKLLKQGSDQAKFGEQRRARQALESAWHVSMSDSALNEDARVQLNQLIQKQALVGLLGSRGRLRRQLGDEAGGRPAEAPVVTEHYNQEDVTRLTNSLNKLDSENLERITHRIVQLQSVAAAASPQLVVTMPTRGRVIGFSRPIQVNPDAEMVVGFSASPLVPERSKRSVIWLVGVCAVLLALFSLAPATGRRWQTWNEALARRAPGAGEIEEQMDVIVDEDQNATDR